MGRVVKTGPSLITVREEGAEENILIYGPGNVGLTVGKVYEFSDLVVSEQRSKV